MLSHFSRVWLCATIWTVVCQPPLSKGFSRKEYWSGWPHPPPGDLPGPGVESTSLTSNLHWQAGSLPVVLPGKPIIKHAGSQIHRAAKARLMPWTQNPSVDWEARWLRVSQGMLLGRVWEAVPVSDVHHSDSVTHTQTQTHTDTDTHTDTHRQTQTHTDTHRDTQTRTDRHTDTHTDTHTQTQTQIHTHTHRHTYTDIDTHTDTHRHAHT